MSRSSDRDRLIWMLQEQDRASNRQIRATLNLSDERYSKIRQSLLDEDVIEKVKGQGGGVRLTRKGYREVALPEATSSVDNERALYAPFLNVLDSEAAENEEPALVIDTSALRKSGKWSNPDITKIAVQKFPILKTHKILVTTYELKQWRRWNIDSVFEAASQRRFAHQAYVVLEWAKGEDVLGLEELTVVCSRFGVGLVTLHPYYSSYRYDIVLEAEKNIVSDDYLEEYLGYVFEKYPVTRDQYGKLCQEQGI